MCGDNIAQLLIWLYNAEPAWQKMAQSPLDGTTQPVDSEEEGRSPTTDRRWLIEKNADYNDDNNINNSYYFIIVIHVIMCIIFITIIIIAITFIVLHLGG